MSTLKAPPGRSNLPATEEVKRLGTSITCRANAGAQTQRAEDTNARA